MDGRYWLWLGARLLVAVAIVAWAMSYMGSGSAEKEFQKTLEALKQVHSFRVSMTASQAATQQNEMHWEVDCQRDILHHQWHLVDSSTEPPTDMTLEEIFVNGQEYTRHKDGSWGRPQNPGEVRSTKGMCRNLAQGADTNLLPEIAAMIKRGILQGGEKKTINGVPCREWLVTMKGGTTGLEHDKICIGLDDHLPYEMSVDWQNSRTLISDYNSAIQFDVPEAVVQPASATSESN
jgi:hypothetical protein